MIETALGPWFAIRVFLVKISATIKQTIQFIICLQFQCNERNRFNTKFIFNEIPISTRDWTAFLLPYDVEKKKESIILIAVICASVCLSVRVFVTSEILAKGCRRGTLLSPT